MERFPERLSGPSQCSPQQQHLAAAAAAVAPHRAEQDLSGSCDDMSCVVPMSSFENNDESLLGTFAVYQVAIKSQVAVVTECGHNYRTKKNTGRNWKTASRVTDTPVQQQQNSSSRRQIRAGPLTIDSPYSRTLAFLKRTAVIWCFALSSCCV